MSEENKIKLEDLPDVGGSSVQTPSKNPVKKLSATIDPRVEKLKRLDDASKIEEMTNSWHFDKPELLFGWIIYTLTLVALQLINIRPYLDRDLKLLEENTMGFGAAFSGVIFMYAGYIVDHPTILILIIPILFKTKKRSDYYIDINFDGISTVKVVNTNGELPHRVLIKWAEVKKVTKSSNKSKGRPYLKLEGDGITLGEMIWDIDEFKKKAIAKITQEMVGPKHPLYEFLKKEAK